METYIIQYKETSRILYCGQNVNEANNWLEMNHYSKDEQKNYQMSIWENGKLLNECITKKIKTERV